MTPAQFKNLSAEQMATPVWDKELLWTKENALRVGELWEQKAGFRHFDFNLGIFMVTYVPPIKFPIAMQRVDVLSASEIRTIHIHAGRWYTLFGKVLG